MGRSPNILETKHIAFSQVTHLAPTLLHFLMSLVVFWNLSVWGQTLAADLSVWGRLGVKGCLCELTLKKGSCLTDWGIESHSRLNGDKQAQKGSSSRSSPGLPPLTPLWRSPWVCGETWGLPQPVSAPGTAWRLPAAELHLAALCSSCAYLSCRTSAEPPSKLFHKIFTLFQQAA